MVAGCALAFNDCSTLLWYWTPANNNWYETRCCICWAAWRYGWIQDGIGRIFSRTKYFSSSGNTNHSFLAVMCFLKVLLPWMVPLFVLWPCTKTNDHKSSLTATSNIKVAILKLQLCQTVKVSWLPFFQTIKLIVVCSFSSQC